MQPNDRKDILKNRGHVYVLDESSSQKKFVEIGVVDNVQPRNVLNPVEIKTPSGITLFKSADLNPQLSFDWYHPGNLVDIERMFRGVVTNTTYDGATAEAGEEVQFCFRNSGEAFVLPGFNGAKTAVTINSVTLVSDGTTTYDVTDDYTLTVDPETGMTLMVHVGAGDIPVGEDIIVDYDYTPIESNILRPDPDGEQVERYFMVEVLTDCGDTDKYLRYFLPRAVVTSEMLHALLEVGEDNTSPNIMPITLECAKGDECSKEPRFYWQDSHNV